MATVLDDLLNRLSTFEGRAGVPVISLYLNTEANEVGRDDFMPFLKKAFNEMLDGFEEGSEARSLAEAEAERIRAYLNAELKPATNTLVIFACEPAGLFEAEQMEEVRGAENRVFAGWRPQLYPLLRLRDNSPRTAVVQVDRRDARILVMGVNGVIEAEQLRGAEISRTKVGGWSQARYQRHVDELSAAHMKDVVTQLAEIVKADAVEDIVLAGDDRVVEQLREMLPNELSAKVIDTMRVESKTREHDLMEMARDVMESHLAATQQETTQALQDAAKANGLGVLGHKATHEALQRGQVSELVLSAALANERPGQAEAYARLAIETGAKVTFVDDDALLADAAGVGALLRYRVGDEAQLAAKGKGGA